MSKDTITERFEKVFEYLAKANGALAKIHDAPEAAKAHIERAHALVEDVDKLVGGIRTDLRGCWTEEGQRLQAATLQALLTAREVERGDMLDALHDLVPELREVAEELTDRPLVRRALTIATDRLVKAIEPKPLSLVLACTWEPTDEEATATEDEEIGDRAEVLRKAASSLEWAGVGEAGKLRAIADEMDNCGCGKAEG